MQSRFYNAGWKLLDVLFPPRCAGCGTWGDRFCASCFEITPRIEKPICQICGDPVRHSKDIVCRRCSSQGMAFSCVRSWALFKDPIQSAIHQLKYRQDRGLGEVLARPLVEILQTYHWPIDLILPVPLDSARRRERGYNQAALLARPVSWRMGIPYSDKSIKRIKQTRQQVGLSLPERQTNLAGAFKADRKRVAGGNILIVDDVITTGSTMDACAQALIDAGANKVYGITLARSSHI